MKQETYNLISLIVGAITLVILAWYTWETRKIQKAATSQGQELTRQIRLSIMPAFTVGFVAVRDGHQSKIVQPCLTNIGNGTAVNIRIDPLAMTHSVETIGAYVFKQVPSLGCGHEKLIDKTEASLPELTDFEVASKKFTLSVRFQDIEGNYYLQEIFMDRGVCNPRPVTAITVTEANAENKVLIVQETQEPEELVINPYQ